MFFKVCLLAAAQIVGDPVYVVAHTPDASNSKPRAAERRPASLPQAQARMVSRYNALVAAMRDFTAVYNGTRTVNASKARAVRRAWKEFEAAEAECRQLNQR